MASYYNLTRDKENLTEVEVSKISTVDPQKKVSSRCGCSSSRNPLSDIPKPSFIKSSENNVYTQFKSTTYKSEYYKIAKSDGVTEITTKRYEQEKVCLPAGGARPKRTVFSSTQIPLSVTPNKCNATPQLQIISRGGPSGSRGGPSRAKKEKQSIQSTLMLLKRIILKISMDPPAVERGMRHSNPNAAFNNAVSVFIGYIQNVLKREIVCQYIVKNIDKLKAGYKLLVIKLDGNGVDSLLHCHILSAKELVFILREVLELDVVIDKEYIRKSIINVNRESLMTSLSCIEETPMVGRPVRLTLQISIKDKIQLTKTSNTCHKPISNSKTELIDTSIYFGKEDIQEQATSPIKPNLYTNQNTLILATTETKEPPRKKTSLVNNVNTMRYDENATFIKFIHFDLQDTFDDIISQLWQKDYKFVQKRYFLRMHNPNQEARAEILNWIIRFQGTLLLDIHMYTILVRMFDHVLATRPVPRNMYQIIVLVISWIVTKCYGVKILRAPNLLRLCGYGYSQNQLLRMERKMFKIFDFNIILNEPVTFASYYLYKLGEHSNDQVKHCVDYLLESFTLSPHFSTFPTSEVAAATVHFSLKLLKPNSSYRRLETGRCYHQPEDFRDITQFLMLQLREVSDSKFVTESYKNYSGLDKKQISIVVLQSLANMKK